MTLHFWDEGTKIGSAKKKIKQNKHNKTTECTITAQEQKKHRGEKKNYKEH